MTANLRGATGVKYVVGRDFTSEQGQHRVGDELSQEDVDSFGNAAEPLIHGSYLYPYWPEGGYEYLPAHIFNDVSTREEILARLQGDPTPYGAMQSPQFPGGKPEAVELSELENADQTTPHDFAQQAAQERTRKRLAKKAADDSKPVDEVVTRKTTAKKAVPTKEKA